MKGKIKERGRSIERKIKEKRSIEKKIKERVEIFKRRPQALS